MSDEDSNDVIIVSNEENTNPGGVTSSAIETRPIIQLFQRLISNDNKENTVLTNAQIISILLKEFNMDITSLHELEVDIYLNVVKRFLKDWPRWDEFDQGINKLRKRNANKSIKKTLESKYIDLKNYLKIQLDATKPLAEAAVKKIIAENTQRMDKVNTDNITLEIFCTRKQLNELILRQPSGNSSKTKDTNVFNLTEFTPSTITVNNLPVESILNWWFVQVTVESKALSFTRSTNHQLKHVLVNGKTGPRNLKSELSCNIQIKDYKRVNPSTNYVAKEKLLKLLDEILQIQQSRTELHLVLQSLVAIVKNDIQFFTKDIKVPGMYRQYSNKYPYYRMLRKDNEDSAQSKYDLYIEETLAPMYEIFFGRVGEVDPADSVVLLTIECKECKLKFGSDDIYTTLRAHYDMYHGNEPDWSCTNCKKVFTTKELTKNKWCHFCLDE